MISIIIDIEEGSRRSFFLTHPSLFCYLFAVKNFQESQPARTK